MFYLLRLLLGFGFRTFGMLLFFKSFRHRLFRVASALAIVMLAALLYGNVVDFLSVDHEEYLLHALLAQIVIITGSVFFALWQFRPLPPAVAKAVDNSPRRWRPFGRRTQDIDGNGEPDKPAGERQSWFPWREGGSVAYAAAAAEGDNPIREDAAKPLDKFMDMRPLRTRPER